MDELIRSFTTPSANQEQKKPTKDNDVKAPKCVNWNLLELKRLKKGSTEYNDENHDPLAGRTQPKRIRDDRPGELDKFAQLNQQQKRRPAL